MQKDVTIEGLEELMRYRLVKDGATPGEVEYYVAAMRRAGWLRKNTPGWMRNSAAMHYALPIEKKGCTGQS